LFTYARAGVGLPTAINPVFGYADACVAMRKIAIPMQMPVFILSRSSPFWGCICHQLPEGSLGGRYHRIQRPRIVAVGLHKPPHGEKVDQ